MKYELIIFDWDGTLMDSVPRIVSTMQLAAEAIGVDAPSDASVKGIIGLGLPEAIKQLFPELSPSDREAIRSHYSEIYLSSDLKPSALFPGVAELLHQLDAEGRVLAIATGKSRKGLTRVMQGSGVETLFHFSRCADETESKPHPAMVNEILAAADIHPSQAVVIGDSAFDMEMAMQAGVDRIAVSYGAGHRKELLQHEPLKCIDSVNELISLL